MHHLVHPSPSAVGSRLPWRRSIAGRLRAALAVALLGGALVACQGTDAAGPTTAWTEAQLAQVFDLSELGREIAVAASGDHLLLDGRALLPELLERFPHLTMGRSTNLLRFSDDALEAMAPEARSFVLQAAPGELRDRLGGYGLGVADLRAAWGDVGTLDLVGLRAVADRLDRAGLRVAGASAASGARLLADLGVTR